MKILCIFVKVYPRHFHQKKKAMEIYNSAPLSVETGPALEGSPQSRELWVSCSGGSIVWEECGTNETEERSLSAGLTSNCFYINFSSLWKNPECQTQTVKLNTSKKTQELVRYWISLSLFKTVIWIISYFWQEYILSLVRDCIAPVH